MTLRIILASKQKIVLSVSSLLLTELTKDFGVFMGTISTLITILKRFASLKCWVI